MEMDICAVGTTGFVNYFCSSERTERKTKEAHEAALKVMQSCQIEII